MRNSPLPPAQRRAHIVGVAVEMAQHRNYRELSQREIAREAEVAKGVITHAFGTMAELQTEIMRTAVQDGIVPIVAQGLAARDPVALAADQELKHRAVAYLTA